MFLPNEIWLVILPYCEPKAAWLSLRPVDHQLKSCVEQHFAGQHLPGLTVSLTTPIELDGDDVFE